MIHALGNELYHFGIPGMRWGVRRFQNKDGTLTAAGKKRYMRDLKDLGPNSYGRTPNGRGVNQKLINRYQATFQDGRIKNLTIQEGFLTARDNYLRSGDVFNEFERRSRNGEKITDSEYHKAVQRQKEARQQYADQFIKYFKDAKLNDLSRDVNILIDSERVDAMIKYSNLEDKLEDALKNNRHNDAELLKEQLRNSLRDNMLKPNHKLL